MTNSQYFTIFGRLPGYNELKDGHWAARQKKKESAMEEVIWSARQARIKPILEPCEINAVCYEPNRRRDEDNIISGAKKIIFDALQREGILINDNKKWIVKQRFEVDYDKDNPRIEVEMRVYDGKES